ncbi:MAG: hypothetical protein FJ050_06925 [Cyanobacteria bacterium M_surface_7_m2_040]|nr:hypothetical protein [Cyanobacteria bacterium M_surface_7_m2_040]
MSVEASLLDWIGNRGRRCSVGDAAGGTGLSLQEVEPALLALVAEVSGRLQVAEDGTLLFVFPPALRMRLLARSGRRRLEARLQAALRLAARLIRLSFGLVLVLVTTLVVLILSVLLVVRSFTSSDADDTGPALLQGLAQVPVSILALLIYGLRGLSREGSSSATPQQLWSLLWDLPGEGSDPAHEGFLNAVFSILFGDGDPNARLESQRCGVVIAEDLAPLLDLPDCPSDPDRRHDLADAAMQPVLLRFDGRPEVSEDGDLIYGFPSLPAHAAGVDEVVQPLRERAFRLSRAGTGQRVAYGITAGSLLVLAPWLLAITRAWLPPPGCPRLAAPGGLAGAVRYRLCPVAAAPALGPPAAAVLVQPCHCRPQSAPTGLGRGGPPGRSQTEEASCCRPLDRCCRGRTAGAARRVRQRPRPAGAVH